MQIPTEFLALGALGGTVALFWDRIKRFFSVLVSLVIEELNLSSETEDLSAVVLSKVSKARWHYKWDYDIRETSVYLKKDRAYTKCYFRTPRCMLILGRVCMYAHYNTLYIFKPTLKNFLSIVEESLQVFYSRDAAFGNFYISNVQGSHGQSRPVPGRTSRARGSRNTGSEDIPGREHSGFNISDRALIYGVLAGVYQPLYHKPEDFGVDKRNISFEGYVLTPELQAVASSAQRWLYNRTWFIEKGITWKRGLALHGKPGCGKSSFVIKLAKHLGIPVYVYNLSSLSNHELVSEWSMMPKPCIALFEDFDAVFEGRHNISDVGEMQEKLTFDTVLNVVDGTNSCDGVLTVLTTNHLDRIDEAMLRDGRIDDIVEVLPLGTSGKLAMAQKILEKQEHYQEILDTTTATETNAEFENRCIKKALRLWETEKS